MQTIYWNNIPVSSISITRTRNVKTGSYERNLITRFYLYRIIGWNYIVQLLPFIERIIATSKSL